MLREKAYIFSRLNAMLDLALCGVAFLLAYWMRSHILAPYFFPNAFQQTRMMDHLWLLVLLPPLTILTLRINGYYDSLRIRSGAQVLRIIIVSVAEAAALSLVIVYFYKAGKVSRGQLLVMPIIQIALLGLKTLLLRWMLMEMRRKGYNFRRVILVGSGEAVSDFIETLHTHAFWGFQVLGVMSDDAEEGKGTSREFGYRVLGRMEETLDYLWDHAVDEVIFIPRLAHQSDLAPILAGCEEMGIRTHFALNIFRHQIARPQLDQFSDVPVVTYSAVRPIGASLLAKYTFDRVGAAILLVLGSPVFALIALLIRLTSKPGEPIFYGQERCGLNGKPFTCWKFRSMRTGADTEREALGELNEMDGPVFKIRNDPRVTPLGRWLRRMSLDELPQIYNVFRGEMSFVGPRPPLPSEVRLYDRWQRRRLSMKPGLTCLWQVSGRNKIRFEEWMRLDLQYIDQWSLLLDLKILLRTVWVVLTGHGAM